MRLRLLTVLFLLAAALWATVPAAAWASDGGEPSGSSAQQEPEDPEPIPDFWTEEEPASGSQEPAAPTSSGPSSTSPGGTEPASGTPTTGPGAPAPDPASPSSARQEPAEVAAARGLDCDPRLALRAALRSLRRAVRGHNLLATDTKPIAVRVSPCVPGTFELAIVLEGTETVIWRARRVLRTDRRATLRIAMTAAGRRFIARASRGPSRTVRMRLRARLAPAAR